MQKGRGSKMFHSARGEHLFYGPQHRLQYQHSRRFKLRRATKRCRPITNDSNKVFLSLLKSSQVLLHIKPRSPQTASMNYFIQSLHPSFVLNTKKGTGQREPSS